MIDFLIIGGGIAGVSTAARLSPMGSVTLLERESALAMHASGRSAAMFEENYGAPSVVALNKASHAYLRNHDGGCLSPRGLLMVATAETEDGFASDRDHFEMNEINTEEALAKMPLLDPAQITRAAFTPGPMDIDTDRLLQGFARKARDDGAQIVLRSGVTAITRLATGWQVHAGDTVFEARHIVNAAGPWADEIAHLAGIPPIGLVPYRRSMARVAIPEGLNPSSWPMLFGPGETWYAKPDAGALIISPADETPTTPHDAYPEDLTLAEGIARYQFHVTAEVTRLLASWAGLRTFAPDRQLVIGPSAQDAGFVWCAGQGGYGMQTSPAASQLLADLIGGTKPAIDDDAVRGTVAVRFHS